MSRDDWWRPCNHAAWSLQQSLVRIPVSPPVTAATFPFSSCGVAMRYRGLCGALLTPLLRRTEVGADVGCCMPMCRLSIHLHVALSGLTWEYFRRKDTLRTHRLHELPDLSAQTTLFQRGFVHIPGLTLLTGRIYFRRTYFTLWENLRPCVYLMAVSHGNPVLPRKLWTFGKFDGNKPLGWTFLVAKHERRDLSAWRLPTRSI